MSFIINKVKKNDFSFLFRFKIQSNIKIFSNKKEQSIFKQLKIITKQTFVSEFSFLIMQSNQAQKVAGNDLFPQFLPLQYDSQSNIYIVLNNAFACKIVQLHLGNKVPDTSNKKFTWYLHPQQTLYLISVLEFNQKQKLLIRDELIRKIYRNAFREDIDTMHFYLNIRKRNKLYRRLDRISLSSHKEFDENLLINFGKYRFFKIYDNLISYNKDENYKYYLLAGTNQKIAAVLFDPILDQIRKVLKIQSFNVCIFENNDFVLIDVKDQ